jgi:hypothetical protein
MNRNRFGSKKREHYIIRDILIPAAVIVALLYLLSLGMERLNTRTEQERLNSARDAVTRASVQCYALEGRYPMNVEYLEANYGLSVDKTKYVIHYQAFASNLMPDIDVFLVDDPTLYSDEAELDWGITTGSELDILIEE